MEAIVRTILGADIWGAKGMPHKLAQKQFEASKQTKEWTTSYWCCSISRLKLKVHETNLHENLKILNHSITESYFLLITGLHLYVYIIVGKALLQCTGGNKIWKCGKNLTHVISCQLECCQDYRIWVTQQVGPRWDWLR